MFVDKVKNFCDHSMILWEMAGDLLTSGHFWTPPPPLGLIHDAISSFISFEVMSTPTILCHPRALFNAALTFIFPSFSLLHATLLMTPIYLLMMFIFCNKYWATLFNYTQSKSSKSRACNIHTRFSLNPNPVNATHL